MKITIYKGLGFAHETAEVEAGKPLRESLPGIDFAHAAVVVNAVKSDGFYKPKESDGIMVRVLPQDPVVATVLGIISIVLAVAGGIAAGVVAYQQKKELERQQEELEKLKSATNSESAINLPFLKGASNSLATGKSQPYVMGRHMFTPYLLTNRWYELEGVDGKDQYVTQALECGFGKQVVESVRADDYLIKTYGDNQPQEGSAPLIDDSQGNNFSAGGTVEIAQDGNYFSELTQVNARVASAVAQAEVPYEADILASRKDKLVFTLDSCAKNVRLAISFPAGVYRMDPTTGAKLAAEATVVPCYSLDGGATWNDFQFVKQEVVGYTPEIADTQEVVHSHESQNPLDHSGSYDMYTVETYWLAVNGYVLSSAELIGPDLWHYEYGAVVVDTWKHRYTFVKIINHPIYETQSGNTFVRNTINEIRFEAAHEFTLADYAALKANGKDQIQIQVVNKSPVDTNIRNSCRLLYYESQCFEPEESQAPAGLLTAQEYAERHPQGSGLEMSRVVSPKAAALSTMLALRMKATEANEKKLQKINIVTNSVARVYDGQEWSQGKQATRNPAAIMLEILTSGTQPLSAFSDEEIETDAFAELFVFCANNGIEFNAVQTQKTMKSKLLENVCSVCRASLYWNAEGKLSVAWDDKRDTVVANLDSDSLVSVDNEKELARPVDAMRVTYVDSSTWTQKTVTVFNNGVTGLEPESVIKELTVTGITSADQAVKYCRYLMACMNIRKKTVMVKVGNEGICFSPCTRITVKDDSLGDTPQDLLVSSAVSNGDGWTLKCVDYDERVYDCGEIPRYASKISQQNILPQTLPSAYVRKGELDEFKAELNEGTALVGKPDTPSVASAKASRDGISVTCLPLGNGARNAVAKVLWQVAKTAGEPEASDWIDMASTSALETVYAFNRATDGYPEREDLFGTTVWRFRAKVRNSYNQESEWSDPASVDVSSYGTWQVGVPIVNTRISDRTVTLMMAQPARSDTREVYGSVRYQVQVQRHDDAEWFKPSTNLNPYPEESGGAITQGNEGNYKDGSGYVISDTKWIQTMPLEGQASKDIHDTLYRFRVKAFNEAHESEWTAAINATALCTNIRDIVQANETAKQAYIKELSAISANIGTITQGSFGGSQNNLWDLSTFTDPRGTRHYEGKMRVGGTDQYLSVDPVLDGDTPTGEYRITFRVGNFEISSTSSNINGELIIQKNEGSLDRTRITPTGTYHEHRENTEQGTPWRVVAREHVNGVESKQVFSNGTLYLTNQTLENRRKGGLDIGNAYLSEHSKVFHFDTDVFDQDGNDSLTIADAPEGSHRLVGDETEDAQIDFTPAILAVAPYSPVGQSLYGQYSVGGAFGNAVSFTVDFWIQYIYAENQTILDVGTPQDRIQLVVSAGECWFERGLKSTEDPEGDDVPFNEEIRMTQMFRQIQSGEAYNNSYTYYVYSGGDYISAVVTASTFDNMVAAGLYEQTCPFNEPAGAHNYIKHDDEIVEFADIGIEFESNAWLHIAVAADAERICVYLNDIESAVCFDRNASASQPLTVKLNEGKHSFILDELMVDPTVKETLADFKMRTSKRTPWAKLSDDDEYFILTANDPAKVKTNLFETDAFRAKVLEIIQDYHS